jgi:uncharacterized NAD(P)/FAD-binding protein YdhS
VIIGGGATGVLSAMHLLRSAEPPRITIVEPGSELGDGIAYGTRDPAHLLNVRAGCLSALPDDPDHFTKWVGQQTAADNQSFLPRHLYGEYLRSVLGPVEHIRARAVQVSPRRTGARITLSNGAILAADRVILATGSSPTTWPAGLGGGPNWIEDPWTPGALADLHPDAPVLLVGTGLTAVDVSLSLQAAGHGELFATSRHGWLPGVHPVEPFAAGFVLPPPHASARSLLAWARGTADMMGDWRPVVDALRPHTEGIWDALASAERARFVRHLRRRWEVLRHRMAPAAGERIAAMRASGQLTLVPGGVLEAHTADGSVDVRLSDRQVRVGAVVNCTGPATDIRRTRDPLVRSLLRSGVARPGLLNLGLETDNHGFLPTTNGTLVVVGPLRRGRCWETTAIPDIRSQAAELPDLLRSEEALVAV